MTDVGHGLVNDLLDLDWRDADVKRPAEHDAVFVDGLAGDEGRQLRHEAGSGVEPPFAQHLAKRPVVEDLDQLRVGDFQHRLMIREQLVVMALRHLTDSHGEYPS